MEEKKNGRYPWNSDENNGEVEKEMSDKNDKFMQTIESMKELGNKLTASGSWDDASDEDLINLGAVCTWLCAVSYDEYISRNNADFDDSDEYYNLISEKMMECGLIEQEEL